MPEVLGEKYSVNPISGLWEKPNRYFGVPWVEQHSVPRLDLKPHTNAIHKVPVADGRLTLDFYAQLNPSDYLAVVFHGANSARAYSYPRFERIQTLLPTAPAFLSFADPTIRLSKELELSWYAGSSYYDPIDDIVGVVEEARNHVGAKYVIFIGGSGGGLPALRLSAQVPDSTAFTQSTATAIRNSLPKSVDKYFRIAWPGEDKEEVLRRYPHRFDMVQLYADLNPSNRVYMLQNSHDRAYLENHYEPFKSIYLHGSRSGETEDGSKMFVLDASERTTHGPPSPDEWVMHWERALMLMRAPNAL